MRDTASRDPLRMVPTTIEALRATYFILLDTQRKKFSILLFSEDTGQSRSGKRNPKRRDNSLGPTSSLFAPFSSFRGTSSRGTRWHLFRLLFRELRVAL